MFEHQIVIPNPRSINQMRSAAAFIGWWDLAPEYRDVQARHYNLRRSPAGNINKSGREAGMRAPAIPFWHPQFEASIELGVRDLVRAAVGKGRWISYTSCEGHWYANGHSPSLRHVGLLPRTAQEGIELRALLVRVVAELGNDLAALPAVAIGELVDRDESWPVLDLYLVPNSRHSIDAYFDDLNSATMRLTASLDRANG